jgi:hypothetical protein
MITDERLAEIEARAKAATDGPWYAHNTDDSMFMNCYSVTTSEREPDTEFFDGENCDKTVVAMTLYQERRIVCHEAGKWEEDSEFIAHARTDVPDLVAEVRRLNDLVRSLQTGT